jgi:hypothetical protein
MQLMETMALDRLAVSTGAVLVVAAADKTTRSHLVAVGLAFGTAAFMQATGMAQEGSYGRDVRDGLLVGAGMATAKWLGI